MIHASIDPVLYTLTSEALINEAILDDPFLASFGPFVLAFESVEIECDLPSGEYAITDINMIGISIISGSGEKGQILLWKEIQSVRFENPRLSGGTL